MIEKLLSVQNIDEDNLSVEGDKLDDLVVDEVKEGDASVGSFVKEDEAVVQDSSDSIDTVLQELDSIRVDTTLTLPVDEAEPKVDEPIREQEHVVKNEDVPELVPVDSPQKSERRKSTRLSAAHLKAAQVSKSFIPRLPSKLRRI